MPDPPSEEESGSDASEVVKAGMSDLLRDKREKERLEQEKADDYEAKMNAEKSGVKAAQLQRILKVDPSKFTGPRLWLHTVLSFWGFDACIGIVILGNAVTLGIETQIKKNVPLGCTEDCECTGALDPNLECHLVPDLVGHFDNGFLGVYCLELILRFACYGSSVLKSNWIKFDAFLVVSSLADVVLQQIEVDAALLDQLMVVRILRAAKLARALRLMVQFRTLWQLVQGLMHSVGTLLWTFLLVMVLICVFAIFGMELIKVDQALPLDHPYNVAAADNFRSFLDAILTLLQLFSFDSIGGIYRPLIKHQGPLIFIYFIGVMLLLSIALMNLVTAVMVNSSLDQASEDKDAKKAWEAAKKAKQMEQLKVMFLELDEDGSGELTMDEINSAPDVAKDQLSEIAGTDNLAELFQMLDYDGGGTVGVEEFCEGVLKATSSNPGVMELGRLVKQCSDILRNSRETVNILNDPDKGFLEYAKSVAGGGGGGGGQGGGGADDEELNRLEGKVGKMEKNLERVQSDVSRLLSMVNEKIMRSSKGFHNLARTTSSHSPSQRGHKASRTAYNPGATL